MPSPFRTTGQLGPDLTQVVSTDGVFYDGGEIVSPVVGTRETGDDGHDYIWVRASAAIASASPGTEVTITEPAFTAATGAGGFRAPESTAVASGEYFWARKSAL